MRTDRITRWYQRALRASGNRCSLPHKTLIIGNSLEAWHVARTVNDKHKALSRVSIRIESGADIVTARHAGRMLAERAGLAPGEHTLIVTAIHELARNIVQYAKRNPRADR